MEALASLTAHYPITTTGFALHAPRPGDVGDGLQALWAPRAVTPLVRLQKCAAAGSLTRFITPHERVQLGVRGNVVQTFVDHVHRRQRAGADLLAVSAIVGNDMV